MNLINKTNCSSTLAVKDTLPLLILAYTVMMSVNGSKCDSDPLDSEFSLWLLAVMSVAMFGSCLLEMR